MCNDDKFHTKNDGFCTKNDGFCTKNDGLCTNDDEFHTKNDDSAGLVCAVSWVIVDSAASNDLSEHALKYLNEIAKAIIHGGDIDWEQHWRGLLLARFMLFYTVLYCFYAVFMRYL